MKEQNSRSPERIPCRVGRGHMGPDVTTRKVLLAGLQWPTLYADAQEWVLSCDTCQGAGNPLKRDFMPLFLSQPQELFERWGMDFVGLVPTTNAHRCRYILVEVQYLTKWVEVKAFLDNMMLSIAKKFYEQIVTQFDIPLQIKSRHRESGYRDNDK